MTTVSAIAKSAFDGVAASITDAVLAAVLDDGAATYAGRVVLGGETAPSGFPLSKVESRVRPAYLEGFATVAQAGWEFVAGGVTYYVTGVRDIVEAGGFQVVNCISEADMLWRTATVERQARTSDGAGGFTEGWSAVTGLSGVSAGLWAASGGERWASQRTEEISTHKALLRTSTRVLASDRMVVDGRTYAITFADNVEGRGKWVMLDLRLGAAP